MIGYPDDAILRRAGLHLPPPQGETLVKFVHAQRRRFKVTQPCSPLWRPFQPGGEPLPGATPEERDAAFFNELKELKLVVATGRVDSLEAAHKAYDELARLDLRKLRIGIPLPRWTEDAFNGEEHRSINDYLPGVPQIPKNPAAWYAKQDAYVQNPTDEAFFQLLEGMQDETDFCNLPAATGATADSAKFNILGFATSPAQSTGGSWWRRICSAWPS